MRFERELGGNSRTIDFSIFTQRQFWHGEQALRDHVPGQPAAKLFFGRKKVERLRLADHLDGHAELLYPGFNFPNESACQVNTLQR